MDVQGTLIDDSEKTPVRGAVEFIKQLNHENVAYMVITNNTQRASSDFLAYLQGIGLPIDANRYLDPLMLLESMLEKEKLAAYGSESFLRLLESMGYDLDYNNPKNVLIATKEDFGAEEYAQMIGFLLEGAQLTGMHETTLYTKNEKRYPGVGAILKMLEYATSVGYRVVGKPSMTFYTEALRQLRLQNTEAVFEDIIIISDDIKGDLVRAKRVGMTTVFVLSGKYSKADEIIPLLDEHEKPDMIFNDIQAYRESI